MNAIECIKIRRSIRKYKPDPIDHCMIDSIVSAASFSPSWKNTQITRYIAIENSSILGKITSQFTNEHNANIIKQAPVLIAVTFLKGRSGFERDGSYSTQKGGGWQMFDAGIACQSFCLAARAHGLGTVILGIFDVAGISRLLNLPEDQELAALIVMGHPDGEPQAPARKAVTDLLQYR